MSHETHSWDSCVGFLPCSAAGSPSEGKIPFSQWSSILHEPIPRRHRSACPPDSQAEAQAQARLLTDLRGAVAEEERREGGRKGGQRWRIEEEEGRVSPGRQEEVVEKEGERGGVGNYGFVCVCVCAWESVCV
ncbi:hypothetical protein CRENBAI_019523 [Crenichthys baileyi]|uniref:Uncharacterized protein n=1 Tax=Crenichthys baileyi TaxID=28760 RepID=A0AAV9QSD4_9TELE